MSSLASRQIDRPRAFDSSGATAAITVRPLAHNQHVWSTADGMRTNHSVGLYRHTGCVDAVWAGTRVLSIAAASVVSHP